MVKLNRRLSTAITIGAMAVLWATSSVQVAAGIISTDIESLAMYAGDTIHIHKDSLIGGNIAAGGNISIDKNTQTMSLYNEGNVSVDRDSTVTGDVLVGSHRRLSTGRNVTITGLAAPHDYVFSLPTMPGEPAADPYGSTNVRMGNDDWVNLTPGAYRDLHVSGNNATLNLSGGVYTFKKIDMSNGTTINLDTSVADVVLNVHNGFRTGHDVSFINSGGGNVVINVYDDNVRLGHDNAIEADVRVWDGNFHADKDLEFTGTLWAGGGIDIGRGMVMAMTTQTPEPGTLMVLAAGGAMLVLRRRREAKTSSL